MRTAPRLLSDRSHRLSACVLIEGAQCATGLLLKLMKIWHQMTNPDRENLKSLAFGMVSDLSRLLADQGFGEQPIDIVEALVFAMFIVADTYSLAKRDQDQAIAVIHGFYDEVQDYFIKQVIIKDHQITDADEIQALADKFHDLSRGRFAEYGERFKQDISGPHGHVLPGTR